MEDLRLFTFKVSKEETDFCTTIKREYVEVQLDQLELVYELTTGSWDGFHDHKLFGWVPYYNGQRLNSLYVYKQGKTKMIMSSILADDNSRRVLPEYRNCAQRRTVVSV